MKAKRKLDPVAAVEVDLEAKKVRVASAAATGRLRRAITDAGYAARELG